MSGSVVRAVDWLSAANKDNQAISGASNGAHSGREPTLGIVIPVFKHSVLVAEAITCAVREAELANGVVVIINDGCPYIETHEVCSSFAKASPEIVEYIRTPNGGLSAARNRGIRYALARFAALKYIYLLDADNRVDAGAMGRVTRFMEARGADWVYPNIDKFGMEWSGDYSAPYSVLRHLFQNVCEAGSLIHRRVFDAGVFFDEDMRKGYEDWEFWLQCAGAGFRGAPCADFGFHYRARRESMVRDSGRSDAEILAYMHNKHRNLFHWNNILRLEHDEAPRFCVINASLGTYSATSVPTERGKESAISKIDHDFWWNVASPASAHFPHFMTAASGRALDELAALGLLDWVFWSIEDLLESSSFVFVTMRHHPTSTVASIRHSSESPTPRVTVLIATTKKCFQACALDTGTSWIDSLRNVRPDPSIGYVDIEGPISRDYAAEEEAELLDEFFKVFHIIRNSPFTISRLANYEWRDQNALIPSGELFLRSRAHMGAFAPLARCSSKGQREIAFIVPVMSFGGVEQVAIQVAKQFKEAGWSTRLIVTVSNKIDSPGRLVGIFDCFCFLNDPSHGGWNPSGYKYFGHDLQKWASEGRVDRLTGLLAGCSVLCNFQAMHSNEVMGWMRRQRVVTVTSLHLIDRDRMGAPEGHPYWMLAYEHAYDVITVPSTHLGDFCRSIGVPREKITVLENAPTFQLSPEMRVRREEKLGRIKSEATASTQERPLRILSLGRLDRQKGIGRLGAVIRMTGEVSLPVEWRLVGSRVLEDETASHMLADLSNVEIQPAVYERSAVMEHLLWADVIVMLSHWEGSPLSILEAQSLGAIPLVTNVGAVNEMISSGEDGVIISNDSLDKTVVQAVSSIELLRSPSFRYKLSRAAVSRVERLSWSGSSSELVRRVAALVARN